MTNETEVEATPPVAQVSRDEEGAEVVETAAPAAPEKPEDTRDYKDVIAEDDDPRSAIYARHSEKREVEIDESQTVHGENGYIDEENIDPGLETDPPTDIIDDYTPPVSSEEMVEVKVYGDTRMVPKSKVDKAGGIAEYQKQLAVSEGMQRNADQAAQNVARESALDERERLIAEQEAALPTLDEHAGQQPPTDPPPGDQNLEELARQHQEAVYDGSADAPSILVKMVTAAAGNAADKGKPFDEGAFRQQVKDELIDDQRKSATVKATRSLIEQHPELNQRDTKFDPRLFTAVDDETSVVRRQHPDWDPDAQVKEAFDRVQKWKGVQPAKTLSDKQDAKRGMNRPRSGTQRYTQPPPAPAPTRSDYVAEQRRLRGQE